MYVKWRQPFIDQWTLPFGKVHNDDESLTVAANREMTEKVGELPIALRHAGDCYIRTVHEGTPMTTMLAHVFHGEVQDTELADHLQWIKLKNWRHTTRRLPLKKSWRGRYFAIRSLLKNSFTNGAKPLPGEYIR